MSEDQRIFVNIASYRDSECQWTVKDLFEKAAEPDRVFVGICWQYVPDDDDDCFQVETRPEQCRIDLIHAKESRGVCWARNRAQKLWRGEEFTLQIDSHMRFVPGWDRILIEMLDECPSEKPMVSTYPIPYVPPNELSDDALVTIKAKHFDDQRVLRFTSVSRPPEKSPPDPQPSAFLAAGFLFGPGQIIADAPYDPHIYFQGEEITLAIRLWTRGWDFFSPNKVVIYHDYTNRPDRVRHWKDDRDWAKINDRSLNRVRHLLGMSISDDPETLKEIEIYGLGAERDLAAYEAFSGINFKEQTINGKRAVEGEDEAAPEEVTSRSDAFSMIWEQNGWGNAESRSGAGATLGSTEVIRQQLPALFDELGIEVLGDAGCGDLNWMSKISHELRLYLGFDIVPGLIRDLRLDYGQSKSHLFSVADIVVDTLPRCDAILCRDCLTHLTMEDVEQTLQQFRQSGSTYLIATTHPGNSNIDIKTGAWCPTDLSREPYNLGKPLKLISEGLTGSPKSLGVWRLTDET